MHIACEICGLVAGMMGAGRSQDIGNTAYIELNPAPAGL